jgi:hypothetical protein
MNEVQPKCTHAPCRCAPAQNSSFCSDHCMDAAGADAPQAHSDCNCGHPECMHTSGPVS